MIDSTTQLVALIGDPVAHSVSPAIQNAAFRELGLNFVYLAFRVPTVDLRDAIAGQRGLGLRGVNITIPHKTAVLPLLDEIDEQAKLIGAVNCIVNDSGRLTGHNTDAPGFLSALRRGGFEPKGEKAVVLGAGGAARAVVFALRAAGAAVTIVNRTPAAAIALAAAANVDALPLTNLNQALAGASLVVNGTSVGMSPEEDTTPLPASLLRPGMLVFDTVYRPRPTRLLKEAASAGCAVIDGLEMLVEQGALAFVLWTGAAAPRPVMRQAAEAALQ
jgi:shikimate dehydrogenase